MKTEVGDRRVCVILSLQVIFGGESECFECQPKPVPTQFPYCTIHATPTKDIHNIIWAKVEAKNRRFGFLLFV